MSLLSSFILTTGLWRAVLLTPGGELPFQMKLAAVNNIYTITVINGDEQMLLDTVIIKGDSLIVTFPVYESELRLKITSNASMEGDFINLTRKTNASIRLLAKAGNEPRFDVNSEIPEVNISGRWSVKFSPETADSSAAIGIFNQNGTHVTGTFLTTSGDYRYLEGVLDKDSLKLSSFDGVFVYLFKARVVSEKLEGIFYTGTHRQVPFTGFRNEKAAIPHPESLTTYKTGSDGFNFYLPDTDSNMVSLNDERFKNKVVIIQIMGSWCPNCLDESRFLSPWYDKNSSRGVEIIGLSFEKTDDFFRAAANVKRFRKNIGINYPLLIAANRDKIKTILPGLENFAGYPTTIYLDKKRNIRKIHAGFSGAATGAEYENFKEEFFLFMDKLLAE